MALFGGLARETTDDLLIRVRAAAVAMLLLGGLFGGILIYLWPQVTASGDLTRRLTYGGAAAAPLVFAFVVYVYLTLGVIPALRERFDNLKRSAETQDGF